MVEKIQLLIMCVCFFLFTNKSRHTAGSQYISSGPGHDSFVSGQVKIVAPEGMDHRALGPDSATQKFHMSLCMKNQQFDFLTRSDTNRAVQAQKTARSLNFQI